MGVGEVEVSAALLFRRGWRALSVTKSWTADAHGGPIEIQVARDELTVPVFGVTLLEIPAMSRWGYASLAAPLALAAFVHLRRRRV